MYKIIGADGNEYGPISADQLRQWIAEGRANLQTRVQPVGATEWTTLGSLPEFSATPPPPSPPPPPQASFQPPGVIGAPGVYSPVPANLDVVTGPAIGLMCVAGLGYLYHLLAFVVLLFSPRRRFGPYSYGHSHMSFAGSPGIGAGWAIMGVLLCSLILFGALKMKKLENYPLAVAASIVAMIPCFLPCCVVGLPIGIWALVVLLRPEVKSAFH